MIVSKVLAVIGSVPPVWIANMISDDHKKTTIALSISKMYSEGIADLCI